MECPFCHKEMQEGRIPSTGEQLRWCPVDESGSFDSYSYNVEKDVPLGRMPITQLSTFLTLSWYCADCRMVITPVPEIESRMDELKRKWNGFTEKLNEKRASAAAQREETLREKQREKRSEERRRKDPWDID